MGAHAARTGFRAMSAIAGEYAVQDAVCDLAQRFAVFFLPSGGVTSADLIGYLDGQGYAPDVATEAALRYMAANAS